MNVMEEIFEIRSCIEILVNDIKVDTTDMLYSYQRITRYTYWRIFIFWKVKNVLNMYGRHLVGISH